MTTNNHPGSFEHSDDLEQLQLLQKPAEKTSMSNLRLEQDRVALYKDWIQRRIAEGKIDQQVICRPEGRADLFADWLRSLIAEGKLNAQQRFPPYAAFAQAPFFLKEKTVAQVIRQLRDEGVLPKRKTRKDARIPQWTPRDGYALWYIGEMRALRYDQVRHLLTRASEHKINNSGVLSLAQTSRIINRWVNAKYTVYRRVYADQPGWIYLTRKGLYHAGLDYRAQVPSDRTLNHLYWINEIRIKLEEEIVGMTWVSERAIRAQQSQLDEWQRLECIPDGIVVIGEDVIDVVVQISKPSPDEVERMMMTGMWGQNKHSLHYYVNNRFRDIVRTVHHRLIEAQCRIRSHIEIIDLEQFLAL